MSNKSETQNPHIIDGDQEDDLIVLAYEDVFKGIQAYTRSLSGRIFSYRIFSVGTMEGALYAIWNKPEGFRVVKKSRNQFQFFFENDSDVTRIERGSPWLFKSFVIHVRRWKQSINMEDNHISSFLVWAQFWGLPEQYKTLEVGRKLGGRLGQIEDVALFEVRGNDTRIVKAKVELNGDKRMRDTLKLLDPNQKMLEIGVRYERIGVFCTYCAKLRHESKNCQCFIDDSTQNNIKEDKVGEWLKADQVGRRLTEKRASFNPNQPRDGSIPAQPKKKSPPAWIFDSF
ncbi:uncharacterized protein LOC130965454 [Arachis stenosperma]|uniref:uncharacterized protein LOC130965454 n=1 Tax=Arachis stenosperma TaxID=217475 RepID=UPI0025AC36C9|nr:uncharacterized protein LOC130965454 [Arachis stenosperma]